jgi:hypothetical protein
MSRIIGIGSHVGLTTEYMADHDIIAPCSIHEVVDANMNWGLRIVPVVVTEDGKPGRDWHSARWVDKSDLVFVN